MKIAFVHDFLIRLGGAERALKVLMDMYPDAPVFTLLYDKKKTGHIFQENRVITSNLQKLPSLFPGMHKWLFPIMPKAVESFDFSDYDIVISSSSAYAHGIISNLETTHITYYHTPMRYAWDYTHEYLKEQKLGIFGEWLASIFLHRIRQWDYLASDRTDIALANSKTVQKRIKKYYRRDAKIIYPPVDVSKFKVNPHHEGYFLIVSTLTPYKRIDIAVELFNKLGKRLVIIGEGSDRARLESLAAENIDFLGFKPDEILYEYMQNCRAFIFPSEEDFGIAPIEAMACGKPVLAYKKGGLSETVIEGKTGQFFEEQNLDSMEAALIQLLINEKEYDPYLIRKRAEEFSREVFEKKMQNLIENVKIETQ